MLLKKLALKNFRNFEEINFDFNPLLTIVIGQNSRGKTNILEAVYFIVLGVGFREKKEEELVMFGKDDCLVEGIFEIDGEKMVYQIILQKEIDKVNKKYFINKVKKKSIDYLNEQTKGVLFSPEQINIITGAPDLRREYFNKLIFYYDYDFRKKLINYENALRRRNKIYEHYQDEQDLKNELEFWNNYLIEQAAKITQTRQAYVDFLNRQPKIDSKEFSIIYLKNVFSKDRLDQVFAQEKKWRQTLIGPQKDDFVIYLKERKQDKNIHLFGSRSEQRLAIFWLKVNEIKYYEEYYHKKPIILLDDIFSEFDMKNKALIFDFIKDYQAIITTTEAELLDLIDMPKSIITL